MYESLNMNHKVNWNSIFRLLQQGLQIIGATKNEQMVISIVPYITLYYAIHSQHASRKSISDNHVSLVHWVDICLNDRPDWIKNVRFPPFLKHEIDVKTVSWSVG